MIIKCEGNFESIDVNRVVNDVVWNGKKLLEAIVRIPIVAWWANEETGLLLPVLLNGVKAKVTDIIINKDTLAWHCGHDRCCKWRDKNHVEMMNYIANHVNDMIDAQNKDNKLMGIDLIQNV